LAAIRFGLGFLAAIISGFGFLGGGCCPIMISSGRSVSPLTFLVVFFSL
jgi:uncharacterized membrane protein YhiD involved in acid resistance